MEEMIKYSDFGNTEANFYNITENRDNISSQINVTFYHLSNETFILQQRFLVVTILKLKAKTS